MKIQIFSYSLVFLNILQVLSAPAGDLVTGLSGDGTKGTVNYTGTWYSGYLYSIHYTFFPSQNNIDTDPVVMWFNGGPGCSSLIGATLENGPFVYEAGSLQNKNNPYSWNKNASLLYLETPPCVGFSYQAGTKNNCTYDDNSTAQLNLDAIDYFFSSVFPELRKNEFYLTGESYAGVFIPYLASMIIDQNNLTPLNKLNLKGILVGNPCTNTDECRIQYNYNPGFYRLLLDQGIITYDIYNQQRAACGEGNNQTIDCQNNMTFIRTNYFSGYNPFDLLSTCQGGQNCLESVGPEALFNNATVQQKMNIAPLANTTWSKCNQVVEQNYKKTNGSLYLYPTLISNGIRIWVYSGDTDSTIPITSTLSWINRLKKQLNSYDIIPWRSWAMLGNDDQPANLQNGGSFWSIDGLTFVRFKGVGHFVPQQNRAGAKLLLDNFLSNTNMPHIPTNPVN